MTRFLWEYRSVPGICFEIHSPQKDETDTELALLAAERSGCAAADILGALGGRMDHAVGNIQLMYRFYGRGMDVSIYDPPVSGGETGIFQEKGALWEVYFLSSHDGIGGGADAEGISISAGP